MQDRADITQFWSLIPPGMTAKEYRNKVKAAAANSGVTIQEFVRRAITQQLEPQAQEIRK